VNRFHAARLPAATAWRFLYLIAQGGLSLALFSVLAHVLPTPAFAATAVAQGALVIAQAVGDFGLSQAAVTVLPARIATEPSQAGELLRGAASSYAFAALAAFVVTLGAALVVPASARVPILLIAPAGAVTVLVSGADGLLRAQGEFRRPPLLVTVSRLGAFAGVGVAIVDRSAAATCAGIAAGTVVASLPAVMVLYRSYHASDSGHSHDLRHASVPLGFAELCTIASGRLDTVLLSAIAGTVAGAGFEATWRIFQLAQYVVGGLATAVAPFIADAYGSGRYGDQLALIRRIGLVVLSAGITLGTGLLVFGGPLCRVLFGGVGPAAARALAPLAIVTPLSFLGFFSLVVLATSPADRWWILPANAIGAVVNVVLVLLLAPGRGLGATTLACSIGLGAAALLLLARLLVMAARLRREASAAGRPDGRMRILVLSSRFPEAGGRGDQVRAMLDVTYLGGRHAVTVLACEPASTPAAGRSLRELAHVEVVAASRPRRALSALSALAAGRPAQCGWMMPGPAWRAAKRLARDADVVLVNTSRSLRGALAAPIVLDHIDALSHNMAERGRGPEPLPVRLFATLESRRMAAWERHLAGIVAAQIGSSNDVASLLPSSPPVHVIPNGWAGELFTQPAGHRRDIDVIFTGNMDYPPNRAGAAWLQREILPRVRAVRPGTTGWIVGRSATRVAGTDVEVASDVPDVLSFLRRAHVAVAPVFGAGSPSKTLEAAASGAAVVSTPWGLECYRLPGLAAADTKSFVAGILALLDDEDARRGQVKEMQRALTELTPERLGPVLEEIVVGAARGGQATEAASDVSTRRPMAPAGGSSWRARASKLSLIRPPLAIVISLGICATSLGVVLARSATVVVPTGCHRVAAPRRRPGPLPGPGAALDPSRTYLLKLTTNCGRLEIKLDVRSSPRATASVVYLVDHGYYDDFPFDRVDRDYVVQVGEPNGQYRPISPGYTIVERPPRRTRYPFGTAAMYNIDRQAAGTAGSEFFIVVTARLAVPPRFTVLGQLVGSRNTVERIANVAVARPPDGTPLVPIVISHATIMVGRGSLKR